MLSHQLPDQQLQCWERFSKSGTQFKFQFFTIRKKIKRENPQKKSEGGGGGRGVESAPSAPSPEDAHVCRVLILDHPI
jgi:hypothetical protein